MSSKHLLSRWASDNYLTSVESVLSSIKADRRYSGSADLRGLVVGVDGQLPEFELFDFQDVVLDGIDFSYSHFSCSFSRCVFTDCVLDNVKFDTCRMVSSRFLRTSFGGASIAAPMFHDAVFDGCSFAESILRGRGAGAYGARRAEFCGCSFDRCRFIGIELRACKFVGCSFEGTTFKQCVLAGVKFQGAGPDEGQFEKCDLQSTRFGSAPGE